MKTYYKYEDGVLERLQQTETEMLKVFDDICQKYAIPYFVGFGTAIGTLRHGGFIPWDDDVDVCMMRDDFEKLKAVPAEEWQGLELSRPSDDYEAHVLIYPQIFKPGTVFQTVIRARHDHYKKGAKHTTIPIWLDIFLFDRFDSPETVAKKAKRGLVLNKLFYYSKCRTFADEGSTLAVRTLFVIKRLFYRIINISKKGTPWIYKKYIRHATSSSGEYIASFDLENTSEMTACCWKYSDVFPEIRMKFGDMTVSVQKNYDEALKTLYGDYMSLPPAEMQINHPPKVLDFGDGKGNVIREYHAETVNK